MKKQIKISLHPLFIIISSLYLLIFITYGLKSMKDLIINDYSQNAIIGIILSLLAISFFIYLLLVRYRKLEIYPNCIILKSYIASRKIYIIDIKSIRKVPVNLFNLKLGSKGVMGMISLTTSGETYNVSDLSNTLRIELKDNEILHISCDNPEEITNNLLDKNII